MIKEKTAVRIASETGEAGTALHKLGQGKGYDMAYALQYLKEVERALRPDFNLIPGELTKREEKELNKLKEWLVFKGNEYGLKFEWEKHKLYGYVIPYLTEDTPDKLANKVKPITYLK